MKEFQTFLKNNNLNKFDIESKMYECFLLNIFEKLVNHLSIEDNLLSFKKHLRKSNDIQEELSIYEMFLNQIIEINLTNSELLFIKKLIDAYLRKNTIRITLSDFEKEQILKLQNYKCNICMNNILLTTTHIDHKIAFKYVGDELTENYQALCEKCNLSKGANLFYFFDSLLPKKY
ncbi:MULTISPECIES: HNH endonuclease [Bacillus cereus group]|uniref:HNH endonuclease n=1 Tax=Bacillus cereus group TaxID=86661 RepID=UPI000BF64417|nr:MULTISPECIES: HNH endonuclease signature motif containing protein [Bacillus cereus group]MDA2439142.1 HNH endonuclease signature motif containing protein [Bacillus cereus]MDA2445399.1 HNH endonuclease signature motif containing protein [Bacillus cereus]PFE24901.1 hypothetical protein CN304_05105 [Bacillus thuringiensis]PFU96495.1 hypothetical protein COK93_14880 [Bacillus thuringiensis]PGR32147.1 hypothetical protein COC64_25560 [Bacillus cereus]